MNDELQHRITELEIKLAHQEMTIEELNQIVTGQQTDISLLNEYLKIINTKLNTLQEAGKATQEAPPPHY